MFYFLFKVDFRKPIKLMRLADTLQACSLLSWIPYGWEAFPTYAKLRNDRTHTHTYQHRINKYLPKHNPLNV